MTLQEAFEKFLARTDNERTKASYRTAINRFYNDVLDEGMPIGELEAQDLVLFRESLQGLSAGSIRTYMSPIRKFFRYVVLRGMVKFHIIDLERAIDVLGEIGNGRMPDLMPRLPSEDALQAVLKAADEEIDLVNTSRQRARAIRDVAILHTLRSTGMRVSELIGMNIGDIYEEEKVVLVHGKGDKDRLCLFDDNAWEKLMNWLYLGHPSPSAKDAPVFTRLDRRASDRVLSMSTVAIRDIIKRLAEKAGVPSFNPHSLRHRVATRLLSQTHDLAGTQDIMGHQSPNTTRRYARFATELLRETFNQAQL